MIQSSMGSEGLEKALLSFLIQVATYTASIFYAVVVIIFGQARRGCEVCFRTYQSAFAVRGLNLYLSYFITSHQRFSDSSLTVFAKHIDMYTTWNLCKIYFIFL